jgi:hypothetical protein
MSNGMKYEDARERARHVAKYGDCGKINCMLNQVRVNEGSAAASELLKEIRTDFKKQTRGN